ncbi:phosphopantetheine-binding protein [Streptomyces sp. NPDC001809]
MQTTWTPRFDEVLREHLPLLEAGREVPSEASLAALGLDSLSTVHLVIGLEDALGVTIPDALLTAENFATAGSLRTALAPLMGDPS